MAWNSSLERMVHLVYSHQSDSCHAPIPHTQPPIINTLGRDMRTCMDECDFLVLQPQHRSGCPGCRLLGSVYAKHNWVRQADSQDTTQGIHGSDQRSSSPPALLPLPATRTGSCRSNSIPTLSPSEYGTDIHYRASRWAGALQTLTYTA